ncbi:hypothetical protein I41_03730 [Lacipirellula limnantheis]|uniref:Uncharacterized protein n=1 Tax=Lacipirellula limnantheis TaxID=2528024 RepID=A0A517TS68_9BACT|nr:hypothetical protein I41_03730 [Lacipirellula limnantheis]
MHFPIRSVAANKQPRFQRAFERFTPNRSNGLQWHAEHPMPRTHGDGSSHLSGGRCLDCSEPAPRTRLVSLQIAVTTGDIPCSTAV